MLGSLATEETPFQNFDVASDKTPKKAFRFLDLSAELRNRVYECCSEGES